MTKKTKVLAVLAMAFAMVLSGCSTAGNNGDSSATPSAGGSSDSGAKGSKTYFILAKSIGPAYWSAVGEGATQAGKDLGVEVIYNGPSKGESAAQINMVQDMLTRKIDGIAFAPNDSEAMVPVMKQANDKGISVVTYDSDSPNGKKSYFVGAKQYSDLGIDFAKLLAEQVGGKGKVGFMTGSLSSQNAIAMVEGAKNYLKDNYPDIQVVNTLVSDEDQQKAFNNAQNLISAHPDLSGIIAFQGAETPAAGQAVEQAVKSGSLKAGQVKITGFGVPSLVKQYLDDGTMEKLITWDPIKLGYATVYVLDKVNNGETIADGAEIPNVGKVQVVDGQVYIGTEVMTKDNAAKFKF